MAAGSLWRRLANIINEGALRAVRSGRSEVTEADLEESIEVVIAGYQKKNAILWMPRSGNIAPITRSAMLLLVAALQSHSPPGPEDHHHPAHVRCSRLHDAGRAAG